MKLKERRLRLGVRREFFIQGDEDQSSVPAEMGARLSWWGARSPWQRWGWGDVGVLAV